MIRVQPSYRHHPPTTHQEVRCDLEIDGQMIDFTAIVENGHAPFTERITIHDAVVHISILGRGREVISSYQVARNHQPAKALDSFPAESLLEAFLAAHTREVTEAADTFLTGVIDDAAQARRSLRRNGQ